MTGLETGAAFLSTAGIGFTNMIFTVFGIFLFLYIAFFAISQGAVIRVFFSEIFPNQEHNS
jgi:hypothetical protein